MKDKAVLAPTCHIFSSLAIEPSSKNTLSCLFGVVNSCLPGLCQSCRMAWFSRVAVPSWTCRPSSWFLAGALCLLLGLFYRAAWRNVAPGPSFLSGFP